ncbi:uncharacterized protein LOC128957245 [Oppia nitens]|uniref:uncharacterized protein LOC128957245 n=1 Tax=Oppia nitens TaxID=1686743 RepID=UPI0023DCC0C0|nr:uncharacterized protein LOC128957245 [Oppia nitens]
MNSKSTIGGTVLVWPAAVIILLVIVFTDHHIGGGGGGQVAALQGVQCPPKPDDNCESNITIYSYRCRLNKWDEMDGDSDQTKRLRECCSGIDELLMRYQLIDYDKSVCDRQPVYLNSDSCRYVTEKLAQKLSTTTTTTTTTVPSSTVRTITTVDDTVTASSSSSSSATDGSSDDTTTTTTPIAANTVEPTGNDGTVSTVAVVVVLTSEEITGINSITSSSSDGRPDHAVNGTTISGTTTSMRTTSKPSDSEVDDNNVGKKDEDSWVTSCMSIQKLYV